MGGDTFKDDVVDEESSRSSSSSPCSCCFSDDLGFKDDVSEENFTNFSNHVTDLRRREKAYQEILQSHDLLLRTSKRKLRQARNEILSYTPGSWSDVKLSDYNIPKTTSIMLVGPKGAGKSSLVNKITRVIEDDAFLLDRAQESFGTPSKGGTYFVQEYMIPRGGSASFCLYDTRGLSRISSSDNTSMIEQWMTRGVLHGEPVIWASDSSDLKDRLIRDGGTGYERRKVNSIIFVVNAVEILKSMECETSYASMITTAFNSPILLFKDDKPAVVMTHGDMLSREERARVRVFLGELLGIPPHKQIFDIPESRDTATAITICNLLCYSLQHADKNFVFLPKKNFTISKVGGGGLTKWISLLDIISIALVLFMALASIWFVTHNPVSGQKLANETQQKLLKFPSPWLNNLTHKAKPMRRFGPKRIIKGPNLACVQHPKSEFVPESEPISIDLHIARRLWFNEEQVAEAEPSFDWRTTRRLWYVE
ncbi:GTP binding domain [Arabidopsis suecica]|uniref:GTP binding domain n=1 Tax=Arabidopsis suecica TaxID=45249 RepID=A0A8T2EBD1_ARASU|nr:GTP binding domain [Arabidopsis suecica]